MNKKDKELRGGLNALFGGQKEPQRTSPIQNQPEVKEEIETEIVSVPLQDKEQAEIANKSQKRGPGRPSKENKEEYIRISAVANKNKYDKICAIATQEGLQIKEVLEAAMDLAINAYEVKHGKIRLRKIKRNNPNELFK